jgi:hypothetical protein
MFEHDFEELDTQAPDHALDGLETDIWKGIASRKRERAAARKLVSLQAIVILLASIGSAAVGITVATPAQASRPTLMPGAELMPSSLLLRNHP